ncbi:MAG: Do family serine endopeptidase [Acidiferrobacterales bacterium]
MNRLRTFKFVTQAFVAGLAIAFVIILIWPQLLPVRDIVEIRQTATPAYGSGGGPVSYAQAVERAAPAVVKISTAKVVTIKPPPFFSDPTFRQFFGGGNDLIRPRQRVETGLGSGVIVSNKGYLLTNNHVIKGADKIQVALRDGRTAPAKIIGTDADTDLAVLKIEMDQLPIITLADSNALQVGDITLAIGNPYGVGQTVTMGIVSATGRTKLGINTFENFIQTDAAINPGNSGGALVDANGNLIGINTAIFSRSGGSQGIGFAIPSNMARDVLEEILEFGRPRRGWLGVEAHAVTPSIAKAIDLPKPAGVIIAGVMRNGPAHQAGIKPGDVVLEINGNKITDARDALTAISRNKPGSQLKLKIFRKGKYLTLTATVIERPQRAPKQD